MKASGLVSANYSTSAATYGLHNLRNHVCCMNMYGLPWWNWLLQAIGITFAYIGAELNSRLDVRGFFLWMAANVVLFVVHVASGLVLLSVLDLIYVRLNIRAIRRWTAARKTVIRCLDDVQN